MHGLINRSIQCFLTDTYGKQIWIEVALAADLGFENFEAMMLYEDVLTKKIVDAAADKLAKSRDEFLEDLGAYLVTHENLEPIRRLLRFGCDTFVEFLHSLDDLQGRTLLAVPDLQVPALELREHSQGNYTLTSRFDFDGHSYVLAGMLRAMADDYGALAILEHMGRNGNTETIYVQMLDTQFAKGRDFNLSAGLR